MTQLQKTLVLNYPWLLTYMELDDRDKFWAVDNGMFRFLYNPSEAVQLKAIIKNPENIKFIKNPSEKVQKECFERDPYMLRYVENYDENIVMEIMKNNPEIICHAKNPSKTMVLLYFHLRKNELNKTVNVIDGFLSNGIRNYTNADIIIKGLYEKDKDLQKEWNSLSRKTKLEQLLK